MIGALDARPHQPDILGRSKALAHKLAEAIDVDDVDDMDGELPHL